MSTSLKQDQVLALAPDASARKAAQGLANTRKWQNLGQAEQVVWGECQGSGSKPYQTRVDIVELGHKCSCPSRKQPCKHILGLLLLFSENAAAFQANEPPGWVSEWQQNRAQRTRQRQERQQKAPDPAAQQKRQDARQANTAAGLAELELWLRDLLRQGLADAQSRPRSFWETPATRMVDAQAPGVARLLEQMSTLPLSGDGWAERLLAAVGRLHLLIEGFRRLDELPSETQADIRAALGWTQEKDELLDLPGQRDTWLVMGQRLEQEEKLRSQTTWLWGRQSQQPALLLDFAFGSAPLDRSLVVGTQIDADLVFYPSAAPLRAVLKQLHGQPEPLTEFPGHTHIAEALATYSAALARVPWLWRFPLALQQVVPLRQGDEWLLCDQAGQLLHCAPDYTAGWHLLAQSGGYPLDVFGEWDGRFYRPVSSWTAGRLSF